MARSGKHGCGVRVAVLWTCAWLGVGCGGSADDTVLSPYLALGDALAHDRGDALSPLGAALTTAAQAHATEPGVAAIAGSATGIGDGDLVRAREAFRSISVGMIEHARANPSTHEGHMIVHCPMTFDGQGAAWVQARGSVLNPYEGARMLHCGDVVAWDAADVVPE